MGFSSSLSIGTDVLCTHVLVNRWRRRTNESLKTAINNISYSNPKTIKRIAFFGKPKVLEQHSLINLE